MAYLRNSIDVFRFILLDGETDGHAQGLLIDSRPGVDGMEFTLLGKKAQPFTMISVADFDTMALAELEMIHYKALVGDNTIDVWKNGIPILPAFRVKVLGVTCLRKWAVATAVGNKMSNQAGAMMECRWDLIAVPL